jgi:hypothetical protein
MRRNLLKVAAAVEGETEMLSRKFTYALALCSLVAISPAGLAAPPTHIRFDVDFSFFLPRLTARCGFPVYRREVGTISVALFFANDGTTLRREDDTAAGYRLTYFSPATVPGGTGGSFTTPTSASLKTQYPQGAILGAPAVLTFTGLQSHVPGIAPQAGRQVFLGEVVFITPEGIPVTDFSDPDTSRGNFDDPTAVLAAICSAVARP